MWPGLDFICEFDDELLQRGGLLNKSCMFQLYASIKIKMEEMQQHNMSWIEVQFLKKAVDVLCQCRQMLMFTYVFAFYLKKNNQSIIFEVSGYLFITVNSMRC